MRVSIGNRWAAAVAAGVLLALVLAVRAPAFGADAAVSAALGQLKSAQSSALKALNLQLKTAQAVFLLKLKLFEDTAKTVGFQLNPVRAIYLDLFTLQATTRDAINEAFRAQSVAAQLALSTLPGPLNGAYPRGFTPGDGGLVDQFRTQADAAVEKSMAALRKRLIKTTTFAEKVGASLTFVVATPVAFKEFRWTENQRETLLIGPASIDTLVGFTDSTLAASGDSLVLVGGSSDGSDGEMVTVVLTGSPKNQAPAQQQVHDKRWSLGFDAGEGNFLVSVQQQGDAQPHNGARIGVR